MATDKRATTEGQKDAYRLRREATFASVKAAHRSLGKKSRRTAYSLSRETDRLSRLPGSKVRKVSANAIRDSVLCRALLDPEHNAVVLARRPGTFPEALTLMTREELMQAVLDKQAWGANESSRRMALEVELGQLRRDERDRKRLDPD